MYAILYIAWAKLVKKKKVSPLTEFEVCTVSYIPRKQG